MSPAPIALQIYSLREQLEADMPGTFKKVADMGYLGVELFGLDPATAKAQTEVVTDLGMTITSIHAGVPATDELLEVMAITGATRVFPSIGPDLWKTAADVKKNIDALNTAHEFLTANGRTLGYHNHYWEFEPTTDTGEIGYWTMLENIHPDILIQPDTYWYQVAGQDPADLLKKLGSRAPIIHIKDGPATVEDNMTALGTGVIDIPAIVEATKDTAEWLVVELDRCDSDMVEAVVQSYAYMTGEGLARGR